MNNPPNSVFMIKELIEMKKIKTALKKIDENEEFYNAKAAEMRELYIDARVAQMGVEVTDENRTMLRLAIQ